MGHADHGIKVAHASPQRRMVLPAENDRRGFVEALVVAGLAPSDANDSVEDLESLVDSGAAGVTLHNLA